MVRDARVEAALSRLVAAGTLDETQAAAVRAELEVTEQAPSGAAVHPGDRLALGVVAAAYVGVTLIAAAVGTLIISNWAELSTPARIVIFAGLTAALIGVGAMLRGRLDPARGLAWLIAVPTAGGVGAAVAGGFSRETDIRFLAGAVTATVVALGLLIARRGAAQVVAVIGALVLTSVAISERATLDDTHEGYLMFGLGVVLVAVAVGGRIPLPHLVIGLAGVIALVGVHMVATDALGIAVVLAAAMAVAAYAEALRGDPAVPLIVATLTVGTMTPRALGSWLDDSLGAAGVLAVSGLVVLGAAAAHLRLARRHATQSTRRS